jgi:drug/metabolite transporter (DMT)-like permease
MLCFAITYAFYKACEPFLSSGQILFFSNSCSFLLILPFALKGGLKTDKFPMIALRTLLGATASDLISLALSSVSLSEVVLLNNTAPLFVPFIVWACYRTPIKHSLWIGLIIGFAGIAIVLRPGIQEINWGLILSLFSGIASAGMLVAIRQIAHERFLKILFYYFLIFALVTSPSLLSPWSAPDPRIWIYLILAGATMVAAQVTLTGAMRIIPSHEVAPFIYTSVIFAGLIDWAVWNNKPGLISFVGMIVVIIGGLITLIRGAREK